MWNFLLFVLSGYGKGSHFSCHPRGISKPFWHIGGQEMYQWGPSFIIFFYTTHSHVYVNTLALMFHVCVCKCCSFWYACMCDNGSMKCPHILTISYASNSTVCKVCVSLSNLSHLKRRASRMRSWEKIPKATVVLHPFFLTTLSNYPLSDEASRCKTVTLPYLVITQYRNTEKVVN